MLALNLNFSKNLPKLLVLTKGVISHEKFLLVEWHFTELANVLISIAFLLGNTNKTISCRTFPSILLWVIFIEI
jgi:hypothetical protein